MTKERHESERLQTRAAQWYGQGIKFRALIGAAVVSAALCVGCSDEGADDSNNTGANTMQPGQTSQETAPTLSGISATSFKITLPESAAPCADAAAASAAKVTPGEAELKASLGSRSAEFLVLLADDIDQQRFPLPSANRDAALDSDPTYRARANAIAASQSCALRSLQAGGGEYLQSFVLINSFSANLTAEQAIRLSKRPDVRSVQLAQGGEPPPR